MYYISVPMALISPISVSLALIFSAFTFRSDTEYAEGTGPTATICASATTTMVLIIIIVDDSAPICGPSSLPLLHLPRVSPDIVRLHRQISVFVVYASAGLEAASLWPSFSNGSRRIQPHKAHRVIGSSSCWPAR